MLYPLKFHPIYKEMPWGGAKIAALPNRTLPSPHIGESWDISCRPHEMGVVANGPYAGRGFADVLALDPVAWLGAKLAGTSPGAALAGNFPLLVKIIDANDDLSIQVHPDDAAAMRLSGEKSGKNEIWYIMDAPEGGELVIGLKDGIAKEDFVSALEAGQVEDCLSRLQVKRGDVVMIPAGLVHAITKGIMLAEIQQNCDLTYRVYDYNRPGLDGKLRELHLDKALEVMDFAGKLGKKAVPGLKSGDCAYYAANKYFAIIKRFVGGKIRLAANPERFRIYTCAEGACAIEQKEVKVPLNTGESAFIPAGLGEYEITGGPAALIESFVPDVERDFLAPLRECGYSNEEIRENCSVYWNLGKKMNLEPGKTLYL